MKRFITGAIVIIGLVVVARNGDMASLGVAGHDALDGMADFVTAFATGRGGK
jgi:hypothetical protein